MVDNTSNDDGHDIGGVIRARWLSPRRKRFWAIVLFLLYSLLGFFAVPPLLEKQVVTLLQEDLGRETRIETIEFNPYAPSLKVQDFQLRDTDGTRLAAFDELYVNFQWASLLKWAWTFSEVRLERPYVHFERLADGELRLQRLLQDFAALDTDAAEPDSAPGGDDTAPRLIIRNLLVNDGHVDARDQVPANPVELRLSPINISIQELNTIPDEHGRQSVAIQLPGGASLKWSGSLTLAPLDSSGELVLDSLQLDPAIAYVEGLLPLESVSAVLSARFRYDIGLPVSGAPRLDVDNIEVSLQDISITGLSPVTEFLSVPGITLSEGKFRLEERSLHFGQLNITRPRILTWIRQDGGFSGMDLVAELSEQDKGGQEGEADDSVLPWRVGVSEALLEDGELVFSDHSIEPAAFIELQRLQARVSGFINEPGALLPVDISGELTAGGNFTFAGEAGVLPEFSVTGSASTVDIPLAVAQPYLQQFAHLDITKGKLNSQLEVDVATGEGASISGSLQIPGLELTETLDNDRLLAWSLLDVDRFEFDGEGLRISQLTFDQPFGQLAIHEDMSTNLARLLKTGSAVDKTETKPVFMDITIGGVRINKGNLDFADYSLPLPFATHITELGGRMSIIATNSTEPANIRLEGQVDEYGLARINGSMNVLDPVRHTDVTLEFRNLLMSSLSPYTVAFAGRSIEQGRLELDLRYKVDQGQLQGANDVVLSDLVLGEKVDHPDAASLPLGLAVSLLKDADGRISIDLPVEGNINDPEFRIGGVIWQAFTGLITKIVSAPFSLLGKLIGLESDDFGHIEFLAGRTDLTPPQLEKISQLVLALQQRPELVVEINGVTDPVIDTPAMRRIRLVEIANQRLESQVAYDDNDAMMLDEEIRAVVEALFVERFPDIPPASLETAHMASPDSDPEGDPVLDELAFAVDLWNRLLASENITEQDLAQLANARAEAILQAFLAAPGIDGDRVRTGQPRQAASEDDERVVLELAVVSD